MFIQILSHASLLVRSGGKTLITDPWLLGSCYWRSWWNYPPVDPKLFEDLVPDAIYITHVHWDHFHGATLKHFPKDTRIIIPLERSPRMKRDLVHLGYENLVEIPHAASFNISDDFKLTSYQFSPWGDSALVVETPGGSLLNANDAKFMGGPLKQILQRHDRFDFALRSHSSANSRICYQYTDRPDLAYKEDATVYTDSFYNFMEKVKPRYAVPFASNHCHLHKEVFPLNGIIQTPVQVEKYVASRGGFSDTELKIMVSGDSWDSETGFDIKQHSYFTDRDNHLKQYAEAVQDKLAATYKLEDKVRVRFEEFERYFTRFLGVVPGFLKRSFKGHPIIFEATYGDNADYFKLDVYAGTMEQIEKQDLPENPVIFKTNALILKRTMAFNMFSHIGISKRVAFISRMEDAKYLRKINELLAAYEYEVLPLSQLFSWRTFKVYLRRWREVILYAQFVIGLRSGKSAHELETKLLS